MEPPTNSLPALALEDGKRVEISFQMLHEVDTVPSDTTKKVADEAGLTLSELRRRIRLALTSRLVERRPAQKALPRPFIPGAVDGIQAPLMNYGVSMSDEATLYCAQKLNLHVEREVRLSSKLVHTSKVDSMGYKAFVRMLLLSHLERCAHVPAGTITIEGYSGQGCPRVYSLFSNYDLSYERKRARRFDRSRVNAIRMELRKGFEGFDCGSRPRLMWHWDTIECGFGYAAPWDEYNLVPRSLTPEWKTCVNAGPVETTEDGHRPQSPRGRSNRKADIQSSR